jgi:glyoxylase-like metal-dependent hydrolase (beta-lactamase superfamily II)
MSSKPQATTSLAKLISTNMLPARESSERRWVLDASSSISPNRGSMTELRSALARLAPVLDAWAACYTKLASTIRLRPKMIFRQLFDSTSSTYTYLLASRHGGEALIIDPVLERVDRYIQLLKELDLRLVKAIDTHLHADHITGLDALRERTRCITVMGEQTKADVVSIRVADGDRVDIEGLSLEALYTPGHTDDSYSFIMPDRVFTGDTLLIRGTGRTDFQNGDPRAQYDSLFGRLLKLPDETLVYPAHDYKGDTVSHHRRGEGVQPAPTGQVHRRICRPDEPSQFAQSQDDGRRDPRQYAYRARSRRGRKPRLDAQCRRGKSRS